MKKHPNVFVLGKTVYFYGQKSLNRLKNAISPIKKTLRHPKADKEKRDLFCERVDTFTFTSWVEQDLIPKLPPERVVIMDNASFHKGQQMKKSIEDAGHTLLYLPTYSPDLNPIEKKWSQAKAVRRRERCDVDTLLKIAGLEPN